jgi:hypothetical protein
VRQSNLKETSPVRKTYLATRVFSQEQQAQYENKFRESFSKHHPDLTTDKVDKLVKQIGDLASTIFNCCKSFLEHDPDNALEYLCTIKSNNAELSIYHQIESSPYIASVYYMHKITSQNFAAIGTGLRHFGAWPSILREEPQYKQDYAQSCSNIVIEVIADFIKRNEPKPKTTLVQFHQKKGFLQIQYCQAVSPSVNRRNSCQQ